MEFEIINPVSATDDELADALILGTMLLYSGCLMPSERKLVNRALNRIDALIASRRFVRRLMAELNVLSPSGCRYGCRHTGLDTGPMGGNPAQAQPP